jgi:hypothetical protein
MRKWVPIEEQRKRLIWRINYHGDVLERCRAALAHLDESIENQSKLPEVQAAQAALQAKVDEKAKREEESADQILERKARRILEAEKVAAEHRAYEYVNRVARLKESEADRLRREENARIAAERKETKERVKRDYYEPKTPPKTFKRRKS